MSQPVDHDNVFSRLPELSISCYFFINTNMLTDLIANVVELGYQKPDDNVIWQTFGNVERQNFDSI